MQDLNLMDEGDLEQKARRIEALAAQEDYAEAAVLQAELEALVQRWRKPPTVRRAGTRRGLVLPSGSESALA